MDTLQVAASAVAEATPDNLAEIIGAIVTLVTAIWAAFKRGRKVGHDAAMDARP